MWVNTSETMGDRDKQITDSESGEQIQSRNVILPGTLNIVLTKAAFTLGFLTLKASILPKPERAC